MEKTEEIKNMNIYEKLSNVQSELKVPKNQYNDFGNFYFRSCEDILDVAKPILKKYKLLLFLSDEVINIGNRNYIQAKVTLIDLENTEDKIYSFAEAREPDIKKGMDCSQITGATSSYARKYALNGLFNLDDVKDPDTNEHKKQVSITQKTIDIKKNMQTLKKQEKQKPKANLTEIDKPMNFGKYKEKTWIDVYTNDIGYLEELIANCKSEKGKEVYTNMVKKVADSFISVKDSEIKDLFGGDV